MIRAPEQIFDLLLSQAPRLCWKWFSENAMGAISLLEAAERTAPHSKVAKGLIEQFGDNSIRSKSQDLLSSCADKGIQVVTWSSADYPTLLRPIYRPPLALFIRQGEANCISLLNSPSVAIVGSRKADSSGVVIAEQLSREVAQAGLTVISGLAVGIDAAAHRGALNAKGKTIAVFGHGLDYLYPASHEGLAAEIIKSGGMLVSQFSPDKPPLPAYFLERNRVIAGLSRAVVVVQATARSGSLATARFGLEEGREILVAPGAIDDPRYEGSNALLKQGAGLVTNAGDILSIFPEIKTSSPEDCAKDRRSAAAQECAIVSYLRENGPTRYEEIRQNFGNSADFETELLNLELGGVLERLPGNLLAAPQGIRHG